jgi:hypothetical protein
MRQTLLATISGYNPMNGTYTAITPDGGEHQVKLGNIGSPPSQVSIVTAQNSTTQFADFKATQ